jgi:hypothetical protein
MNFTQILLSFDPIILHIVFFLVKTFLATNGKEHSSPPASISENEGRIPAGSFDINTIKFLISNSQLNPNAK